MKFKVLFIIALFACAVMIGAGLGFAKIYLDSTVNPTIAIPDAVAFDSVNSEIYDYIDYAADASFTMAGYIKLDRSILLNCYDQFNAAFHCSDIMGDFKSLTSFQSASISTLDGSFSGEKEYEREPEYPYMGKIYFNAPDMFGDVISHSSINCMAMATAHVNDGDHEGLHDTRKLLRRNNVTTVGIADSKENRAKYEDIDNNGVNIRIYSYTEKINRPLDKAFNFSVNMLSTDEDVKKLAADVSKSKHALVDVVICSVYFNNNGFGAVTQRQRNIMKQLLDAGADIVYGTNPDIVEPMEVRSKKLKSGKTKYQFGFYSLGCLLSGAKGNVAGVPKNSGLVAKFKYDSDNEGSFFTDVSFSPTYCVSYPSVEDETTAGAHVKVFAMNNVIEYLNDNGSTDSTVKITKPAVNHPYKPDDLRYVPSKTKKKDKTEEVASAGGLARISGFAVIKANAAAKKKEYNDPFYTDNLTKSDFNTIKSAYYDLPRRLFSQSKHKYYEKDGWFYIKK